MGRKARNYTGQKFNRLTAICPTEKRSGRGVVWLWKCDCGGHHECLPGHVMSGSTKSCGCILRNPNDMQIGAKFGWLTLLGNASGSPGGKGRWLWLCECGKEVMLQSSPVTEGRQVSCGCYAKQGLNGRPKHGMHKTRTYRAWIAMKSRCFGDNSPEHYKLRGITISDEWANSFDAFFSHMGECPDGLTLERIDNARGYAPGNCRWATQQEQLRNTRRTIFITFNGQRLCLKDACAQKGVPYARILSRIHGARRAPQEAFDAP